MNDAIFRTYDIRGRVGVDFVPEDIYDFARALAYYFKERKPDVKTIAVGMDGRTHSPAIKENLVRGLQDSGLDVLFVGMCPTPVLYFSLHTQPVDAGVMITASHNPKEYNGIKMCLGHECVWGPEIFTVRDLYKQRAHSANATRGTYREVPVVDTYVDWMVNNFAHLKNMKLSAVVDCGNAVGGAVMPQLIERMGWKHVSLLYSEVDGTYPNHEADPTKPKNMADVKQVLATTDIQVGIGFDGDVDRMGAMTKDGFLVPGDQLLSVYSREILKEHPGAPIVFDIKASSGLIELLTKWGAQPQQSPTGNAWIKKYMGDYNAVLGGELSCHFIFNDRYFGYDDGIYAMMRLFEIMEQSGKSLQELIAEFPKKMSSPEIRIPCAEQDKRGIVQEVQQFFQAREATINTIDGVTATMSYGWGNLRPSNTEPVLSLRFEANDTDGYKQLKSDFSQALSGHVDAAVLHKSLDV